MVLTLTDLVTTIPMPTRSYFRRRKQSPSCSASHISTAGRRRGCKWFLFLDRNYCFRRGWRRRNSCSKPSFVSASRSRCSPRVRRAILIILLQTQTLIELLMALMKCVTMAASGLIICHDNSKRELFNQSILSRLSVCLHAT